MVKKTLLFFVLLFIAYNAFLMLSKKDFNDAQYQYQANIIAGDKYIYQAQTPANVIIGTSLSEKIVTDSLPHFYNLALAGMGMLDGYNILTKRNPLPKAVFIESNLYYHTEKEDFKKAFDSKTGAFFKDKFWALRDENQPVSVLAQYLEKRNATPAKPDTKPQFNDPDPPYFDKVIAFAKQRCSKKPVPAELSAAIKRLKNVVNYLTANGSKVYLFEMPVNPALKGLPLIAIPHDSLVKAFPNVYYIPPPTETFKTSDGIHLRPGEAMRYTLYFKNYVLTHQLAKN